MEKKIYDAYTRILHKELIVALGCTEPIAIAYAAAKAKEVLGCMPERCEVLCSGNIIKNVKGVTVPNSGGLKGIDVAAILGLVGGDADKELAVLESVTQQHITETKNLLETEFCQCRLIEGVENLYIIIRLEGDGQTSEVEIRDRHSNITKILKNGEVILQKDSTVAQDGVDADKELLNVKDILEYASTVRIEDIRAVIARQVEMNTAISQEGMSGNYGACVGKTILTAYDASDVRIRAKAAAAAGSDARMSGCPMPVVINSGSGNQGITVTLPLVEYAKAHACSEEQMYRGLVAANLISLLQKRYIGSLSAYCGAVSAACGSAAGICYMLGGDFTQVSDTITNTIATIGGMVCDGAKPSCAAKIAASVDTALTAMHLSANKYVFANGEGLVKEDVEKTIQSIGRMGREGMKSTDVEILNIMLEK